MDRRYQNGTGVIGSHSAAAVGNSRSAASNAVNPAHGHGGATKEQISGPAIAKKLCWERFD